MKWSIGILLLFSASLFALEFDVKRVVEKSRVPFAVEQVAKYSWFENAEKVRVLSIDLVLSADEFSKFTSVRSLAKTTKVELKGRALSIQLSGQSEKFLLKNDKEKLFLEVSMMGGAGIVDENCERQSLVLKTEESSLPFYLGTSCIKQGLNMGFALTFPKEVEFSNSTLFETRGKGESWRYYDLPAAKLSGQVGRFVLEYQKKSYAFTLESLLAAQRENVERPYKAAVTLGGGLLKINGDDFNATDLKPILGLQVPHYPVWNSLGLVLNVDATLPLSLRDDSMTYTQVEIYGSYEFSPALTLKLRPKLGYIIFSQIHDLTRLGLSVNQIAGGIVLEKQMTSTFYLLGDLMSCGISSAVKFHYSISMDLLSKFPGRFGWGIGLRLQAFSTEGETGLARTFSIYSGHLLFAL